MRAFWVISDQALSSLANAALTIVVARTVSAEGYGAFALAFAVYSLVIAMSQSVSGQVVVIRYSAESPTVLRRAGSAASGAAILLGGACAGITAAASLVLGAAPPGDVLLAVGVLLPALVLQDTWRTVFIAHGKPVRSFVNDVVWVAAQAVSIGTLVAQDVDSAAAYVVAWGSSAAVAAIVGCWQHGVGPRFRGAAWWFSAHREVSVPSLANALAILGTTQIALFLIAAIGSVEDVGPIRAAQTLLGPLNILGFALASFSVPEIVRRSLSRRRLTQVAVGLSAAMALVTVAWGTTLLLLPDDVGVALLGETWPAARDALPAMVAFACLTGATTGASAVMRALNRVKFNLAMALVLGPLIVLLSTIGVSVAGATGAAYGFAAAAALAFGPSWFFFVRALRLGRREQTLPTTAGSRPLLQQATVGSIDSRLPTARGDEPIKDEGAQREDRPVPPHA
ncbi:hypothetical protein [Blastococcus montanus]|uniref:hypothetical protein n=1 Tax=Blastococcus montanus TaxID=3144973 RepID=UPI003207F00D